MGIIKKLSTDISNKIAAGEVVERPASVIKELVENAIDAGSSVISVEIQNGGVTYMRVTDNGCGMERDDAQTSFLRHATSKIHTEQDLNAIYTLGFRGEALSSIGAVAAVELCTKRQEDEIGTKVVCRGGEIEKCEDAGVPDGTSFVVKNLFYNTPARMNFLKKNSTEAGYITDIMTRFILSRPDISFRYVIDGKEKYFTAGDNSLTNCIYAVYGKNYAKSVIAVDYTTDFVRVTGMIGKGDASRPNRGYQSFFVNRRYIKSVLVMKALEEAYKNQIMIGKYPMAILNLEINPAMIDINVHPTKLEVKFSNDREVYQAVYYGVKNALYALPNVPKIEYRKQQTSFVRDGADVSTQIKIPDSMPPQSKRWERPNESSDYGTAKPIKRNPELKSYAFDTGKEYFEKRQNDIVQYDEKPQQHGRTVKEQNEVSAYERAEGLFGAVLGASGFGDGVQKNTGEDADSSPNGFKLGSARTAFEAGGESADNAAEVSVKSEDNVLIREENDKLSYEVRQTADKWGFDCENVRVIGQIFDTYIIAEQGDTMIIADQHAAHERLKYEELKAELSEHGITSQMMLVPVVVDLSPTEFAAYIENTDTLERMGFETEVFGDSTILVRATPEALDEAELKSLVIELIDEISDNRREVIAHKNERMLYTIACKAAIKANHRFDNTQLEKLLKAVLALDNINTCPHGRPIIVTMTKKELEKEFKRIV
ncbi:MAG: DNA mismatch repair endonuclease MutL [Firmicutes bacterium]|nr:DNA mismatch repair endonuclease MutL [Bacillota bacterium]